MSHVYAEILFMKLYFHIDKSCRPQTCSIIKNETLTQVFSYEFCEISKNTFFYRIPPVAAFVLDQTEDRRSFPKLFSGPL